MATKRTQSWNSLVFHGQKPWIVAKEQRGRAAAAQQAGAWGAGVAVEGSQWQPRAAEPQEPHIWASLKNPFIFISCGLKSREIREEEKKTPQNKQNEPKPREQNRTQERGQTQTNQQSPARAGA